MTEQTAHPRRRVIASLAVLAAAVVVGGFLLGGRMRAAAEQAPVASAVAAPVAPAAGSARPATATATPTAAPARRLGPADHGPRTWRALTGGECLRAFGSPWRTRYDVVACRTPHAAQLLRAVTLPDGAYPSRAALRARLGSSCRAAVSSAAATRYRDVRLSTSYPTAARWKAGDRTAYCFVSRAGGGALVGDLAAERG